jgi:hypothetical protein
MLTEAKLAIPVRQLTEASTGSFSSLVVETGVTIRSGLLTEARAG